jgi:hypothetical protein
MKEEINAGPVIEFNLNINEVRNSNIENADRRSNILYNNLNFIDGFKVYPGIWFLKNK